MAIRSVILTSALTLACAAPGRADWAHLVQACHNAASQNQSAGAPAKSGVSIRDLNTQGAAVVTKWDKRYPWEDCVLKLTGLEPVAPVFGSLGTGGGIAIGARGEKAYNSGRVQSLLVGRGLISFNGSYVAEARVDVMMPTIGQWTPATATFEDQVIVSPFVRWSDLRELPFYGIGPSTGSSAKTTFSDQRTEVGMIASIPLRSWLTGGGGVTYFAPDVDRAARPNYIQSEIFARVHTPTNTAQTAHRHDARIRYDIFSDRGGGGGSFRRLQAFVLGSYEMRADLTDPFADRSWLRNFLCQPIVGDQCRIGNLVVDALVTNAFVGGHAVPFYLQDTLGGTDRDGFDTVRGFDDFRFRAPNRALVQADFYKDVNGWFGVFAFADLGTVALRPHDLTNTKWRHDYGSGVFVRAGGRVVMRAYVAFGSGEGVRQSLRFTSAL